MTAYSWKDVRMTIGGVEMKEPIGIDYGSSEGTVTANVMWKKAKDVQRAICGREKLCRWKNQRRKALVRWAGGQRATQGWRLTGLVEGSRELGVRIPRSLDRLTRWARKALTVREALAHEERLTRWRILSPGATTSP
jgi:hypothetical protein